MKEGLGEDICCFKFSNQLHEFCFCVGQIIQVLQGIEPLEVLLNLVMSDFENYETTFNHFLLHFPRYLCNFCPNTCSQEAILMKVSHLGVVTLPYSQFPQHTVSSRGPLPISTFKTHHCMCI